MQNVQNNFKSWIKHEDAILTLNFSDTDDIFLEKKKAARIVNIFLGQMTGEILRRFDGEE